MRKEKSRWCDIAVRYCPYRACVCGWIVQRPGALHTEVHSDIPTVSTRVIIGVETVVDSA